MPDRELHALRALVTGASKAPAMRSQLDFAKLVRPSSPQRAPRHAIFRMALISSP